MDEQRTQFTFYESFKKAANRLKRKADRADLYDIISDYALYGICPDLDTVSDPVAMAFELCRPVLESSRKKARSGRAGGTAKQSASKQEANAKQTGSEKEKEKEKEVE